MIIFKHKISLTDEIAMAKIQALIGANRGWISEQEMIEDMSNFRRKRAEQSETERVVFIRT